MESEFLALPNLVDVTSMSIADKALATFKPRPELSTTVISTLMKSLSNIL